MNKKNKKNKNKTARYINKKTASKGRKTRIRNVRSNKNPARATTRKKIKEER